MVARTDAAPRTDVAAKTEGERIAALEASYQHLATKADIEKLKADIEKLKADLTWRIVLAMGIMTGIIVAAIRLP